MCLLAKTSFKNVTYFVKQTSPVLYFSPQVHIRMSLHHFFLNFDKIETITNIWPYATDTI